MNRIEQLTDELNKIIGLLEVSDCQVFDNIRDHDRFGIGTTIGDLYNGQYSEFQIHICNSALLLGFSYFESFVCDILALVLDKKPELNKHKFTLKYVIDNKADLFRRVTEDYLKTIGFTEALKCLEKELHFFEGCEHETFLEVYNLRNCIVHNAGIADDRVHSRFSPGERIVMNSGEINSYGLLARKVSSSIWQRFETFSIMHVSV